VNFLSLPITPAVLIVAFVLIGAIVRILREYEFIFPIPIDIIKSFLALLDRAGKPAGANGADRAPLMQDIAPISM